MARSASPPRYIECQFERAAFPAETRRYDLPLRDPLHDARVLRALYGEAWIGVLLTDGTHALAHAISPRPVPGTPHWDVDPLFGYGSFRSTTQSAGFLLPAMGRYRASCAQAGIAAEVLRLDPLAPPPALPFPCTPVKEIVVVDCHAGADAQLEAVDAKARRRVRRGQRDHRFVDLPIDAALANFVDASLQRVGAHPRWHLGDEVFARMAAAPCFRAFGVYAKDRLVSACVVAFSADRAHYLLAGNAPRVPAGASELLIFETARRLAGEGVRHFILGGGNSAAPDDPLLRFKRKFAPTTRRFCIGRIVHDRAAYRALCGHDSDPAQGYFLRHRRARSQRSWDSTSSLRTSA